VTGVQTCALPILADLIDIMDNGTAYVNVHTKDFPLGEIRGQIAAEGDADAAEGDADEEG
jgi:hypothetical protein